MFGDMTASWLFVALIESCVGSAMALHGWKQKEHLSLGFGIVLTLLPGVVHNAWLSALTGLVLVVLFFLIKRAA